jgi:hypothetical protein
LRKGYVDHLFNFCATTDIYLLTSIYLDRTQFTFKESLYDRKSTPDALTGVVSSDIYSSATDDEDWTNEYPIAIKYKDLFDDIASRWRVTPLHAFHPNGKFVNILEQEAALRGALVVVHFKLKHYAIKNKRTNGVGGNTFSAVATEVQILERPAEPQSTPYKSLLLKGPTSLPQSPSKKKDQARAVQAFHPGTHPNLSCYPNLLFRHQPPPPPALALPSRAGCLKLTARNEPSKKMLIPHRNPQRTTTTMVGLLSKNPYPTKTKISLPRRGKLNSGRGKD